jgi:hypothetical protein
LFGVEDVHTIGENYSIPVCAGQSSLKPPDGFLKNETLPLSTMRKPHEGVHQTTFGLERRL